MRNVALNSNCILRGTAVRRRSCQQAYLSSRTQMWSRSVQSLTKSRTAGWVRPSMKWQRTVYCSIISCVSVQQVGGRSLNTLNMVCESAREMAVEPDSALSHICASCCAASPLAGGKCGVCQML
eukprot:1994135-Ditylum_brightwellii.AAC.1